MIATTEGPLDPLDHHRAIRESGWGGRDKGTDIPVATEFVRALKPLPDRFGDDPRLTLILFTLDEDSYARELAPLAGHYPAPRLGPPWWFHDSTEGCGASASGRPRRRASTIRSASTTTPCVRRPAGGRRLVERLWDEARTILSPPPGLDVTACHAALMARFADPALRHRTRRIAMDGSQKLPQRLLGSGLID